MPPVTYPFRSVFPSLRLRPYVPLRVTNPVTGQAIVTYALIDTGADSCVLPGWLAKQIGHKVGSGVSKAKVGTGAGTCVSERHTCKLEVLDAAGKPVMVVGASTVQVLPKLKPALVGVTDCLDRVILKVDYPLRTVTLIIP